MGSNTSTNTDTNNIYTEQQYVETMEDKYAELLRQNELLRQENEKAKEDNQKLKEENELLRQENEKAKEDNQKLKEENELLKSGNYNLKRDNDNLRGDIYNLRLENSKMTEDNRKYRTNLVSKIQNLEEDKQELVQLLEAFESNSRLLPKVAEKDDHKQFMLDCVIPVQTTEEHRIKQTALIESILRGDDYIIFMDDENLSKIIITNLGKIFQRKCFNYQSDYMWGYTDLKIKGMTEEIKNVIVGASKVNFGANGYVYLDEARYTFGLTARGKHGNIR
jgi:predicted RNase H-like nuclease (RuvC/YqgF family)